jgi:hypothetical protein
MPLASPPARTTVVSSDVTYTFDPLPNLEKTAQHDVLNKHNTFLMQAPILAGKGLTQANWVWL